MRLVNSFTTTKENSASLEPRFDLKVQKEILTFDTGTAVTPAQSSQDIPQNYERSYNMAINDGWAVFKATDGSLYLKAFDITVPSNYTLGTAHTLLTSGQWVQRGDIISVAAGQHAFWAIYTGGAVQVRIRDLSSGTAGDFGPTIARTLVNTSTLVRRIEAVCAVRNTTTEVIVAISTFDFVTHKFTIEFFCVNSSAAYQLDNIIQGDFTGEYASWWADNTWASYICASTIPDGFAVYALAHFNQLTVAGNGVADSHIFFHFFFRHSQVNKEIADLYGFVALFRRHDMYRLAAHNTYQIFLSVNNHTLRGECLRVKSTQCMEA